MPSRPVRPAIDVPESQEREYRGSRVLATACILNLAHVAAGIEACGARILRAHGLTSVAAFNVLTILDGAGSPLAPSVIASRMIVTRGTMTGIVDSLERRHLVSRLRDTADGRMRRVEITGSGSALVRDVLPALHAEERRIMDALPVTGQRQLLGLIAVLQARVAEA